VVESGIVVTGRFGGCLLVAKDREREVIAPNNSD
jgi:hypothetical protein